MDMGALRASAQVPPWSQSVVQSKAEQSEERQRVLVPAAGALSSVALTLEMRQSSLFPRWGRSPAALLGVTQP